MADELEDFMVTKTTTEVYAVAATGLQDAENAVAKGEAELIQRNTQINSRPKPPQQQLTTPAGRVVTGGTHQQTITQATPALPTTSV